MIRLPNGFEFRYLISSGAIKFGKGWLMDILLAKLRLLDLSVFDTAVTKTLTRYPKKGRYCWYKPWQSICFIDDGIANAVKLTNPGIEWWCDEFRKKIDNLETPLIVSIAGNANEIKEMVEMLNEFKSIVAVEINMGCPNVCNDWNADEVIGNCKLAFENSRHPIILKLSVAHSIEDIIPYVEEFVEAISINSVPWSIAFPNSENPFARYGIEDCGVSGKTIQSHTWSFAYKISETTSVPVIYPSVWEFSDIKILKERFGVKAYSLGSIFFYPWKLRRILKEIRRNI